MRKIVKILKKNEAMINLYWFGSLEFDIREVVWNRRPGSRDIIPVTIRLLTRVSDKGVLIGVGYVPDIRNVKGDIRIVPDI